MNTLIQNLMDKKRVVLFDFDGTVFDTAKLKENISVALNEYTTNTDLLWETERKLRNNRFHLIETMRQFCEKLGITHIQHTIQDIFLNQNFPAYIFPDVISNLKALRKENILALYTEGDETYQQVKIYQSYLNQLFDFIYIFHRKIPHLMEIVQFFDDKEVWFVDNHISHLQKAQEKFPQLKTIWLNRENLHSDLNFVPDIMITSLDDLLLH